MATRDDLQDWIIEALTHLGRPASVVDVCKIVWQRHEHDLRASEDLFYTWQYDIRWAAQKLRDSGKMAPAANRNVPWQLV
jgi:hypothetical protein